MPTAFIKEKLIIISRIHVLYPPKFAIITAFKAALKTIRQQY